MNYREHLKFKVIDFFKVIIFVKPKVNYLKINYNNNQYKPVISFKMGYFDVIAEIYNTAFSFFFFVIAILMFYIAIRGLRANRYGGSSTIMCGLLYLFFGFYNSFVKYFPFPYNGFIVWWIGIVLIINFIFTLIVRKEIKKIKVEKLNSNNSSNENLKKSHLKKFIELMTNESPYRECISIKMEGFRKSFHLLGLLIALAYFGFFSIPPLTETVNTNLIQFIKDIEWSYKLFWGDIEDYPFTKGDFQAVISLTMFSLIGSLVFVIISDLIRILWGPEYSIFSFLTRAVLRDKENNAAGPHIYLISGIVLSYMLYFVGLVNVLAFFAGALIACLSDAAAALIGRKYGNHKIKCINGEMKSFEGFVAGIGSAYLIGLICVGPIYAIISTLIFFIIDYFPTIIADNLLNPILITIGIQLSVVLFGLPIGLF